MKQKPNILFILADDQGAWSLGSAGNNEIITPNLDKLAQNGLRFENFFCASPVCSPARASIATAMMPSGHGVLDWLCSGGMDREKFAVGELAERYAEEDKPIRFLEGMHTYPEVLAKEGYTCALSGKWHLGDHIQPAPGFTNWYTIGQGGCPYFSPDIVHDGKVEIRHEYITDLITQNAIEQLDELSGKDKPFYLSVHYTAPHSPWDKGSHPQKYLDLYKDCAFQSTPELPVHPNQTTASQIGDTPEHRREFLTGYYAAITAMDEGIGQILNKLEELGERENTLIVFTADNGVCMGHHGVWGKGNATLPQNMYEESVKVPAIVWTPELNGQGKVAQGLYSHCDWYNTLLDYAGVKEYPENSHACGKSFAQLLKGQPEQNDRQQVFVFEEYGSVRMVRNKQMKYIHRYPSGPNELYDLEKDPQETYNLVHQAEYRSVVQEMQKMLFEQFEKCTDGAHNGLLYPVEGRGQRRKLDGIVQGAFLPYVPPAPKE